MSEAKTSIRIGTSGWYYNHWHGLFYPETIAKHKWFEHYTKHFDTVEINSSFYHMPKPENVKNRQIRRLIRQKCSCRLGSLDKGRQKNNSLLRLFQQ